MKHYSSTYLLSLALICTGCATDVVVIGDVPTPLSKQLPVTTVVVLDEAFKTYTYSNDKKRKISFAIGEAQTAMFRTVSAALFRNVKELHAMPSKTEKMDFIVAPQVEEIQLATPFETHLKVFEVWIKYNLKVFNHNGEPLADWIMTAYGKTPTRFLTSDEEALNQAAMVALRDAGARLILEFPRVPEISVQLHKILAQQVTAETTIAPEKTP